jgi:iron complex transport system ATP-binding protein
MLALNDVCVSLGGRQIVAGVTLQVRAGESVALLGRNGAGKSTLVKALAGLLAYGGEAVLESQELRGLPAQQRGTLVGYVAQDLAMINARLTVFELLLLAQNTHRLGLKPPVGSYRQAETMLESLGIAGLSTLMPMQLSGGQRQLVALALALVNQPRLLLLDEPTSALDLANQFNLLDNVERYTRSRNIVTLMVLHDLNLASRYAGQCVILHEGRIQAQGRTHEILTRERLADVYGVDCQIVPVAGQRAIFPIERYRQGSPLAV